MPKQQKHFLDFGGTTVFIGKTKEGMIVAINLLFSRLQSQQKQIEKLEGKIALLKIQTQNEGEFPRVKID